MYCLPPAARPGPRLHALASQIRGLLIMVVETASGYEMIDYVDDTWASGKIFFRLKKAEAFCDDDTCEMGMKACERACGYHNGTLACIQDKAQQKIMKQFSSGDEALSFIGYYQLDAESKTKDWHWTADSCADNKYEAWKSGEPNDYGLCRIEQCAVIGYGGASKWVDAPCGMKANCVCEYIEGSATSSYYLSKRGSIPAAEHCAAVDIVIIIFLCILPFCCCGCIAMCIISTRKRQKNAPGPQIAPTSSAPPPAVQMTPMPSQPCESTMPMAQAQYGQPPLQAGIVSGSVVQASVVQASVIAPPPQTGVIQAAVIPGSVIQGGVVQGGVVQGGVVQGGVVQGGVVQGGVV